ncbi:MAG: hypothetical protein K2W82_18900 [Candidatus Obscuribacterales bacterium]|nr:hypothetical protein [Candidatus Obscuribacterales bacterium]
MVNLKAFALAAGLLSLVQIPAVYAQFIDDDMGGADASFQQNSANFSSSLDSTASDMRQSYDASQQAASNRNLTNMQANQDTTQAAQQAFQNTQEQMVLSGGAYNSQGFIWGGLGGFGGGGLGLGGGFGGGSSVNWGSGAPAISAPRYGNDSSVLSRYYGNRPRGGSRGFSSN